VTTLELDIDRSSSAISTISYQFDSSPLIVLTSSFIQELTRESQEPEFSNSSCGSAKNHNLALSKMDFLPTQTFPLSLLSRDAPFPEATPTTIPQAEEEEKYSSLALCLVLVLLIGSFFTSYYLKIKKITAVHETIVGLFAGMIVGLALRLGPGDQVQRMLSFSNNIMLNVLLPPIILASGYDLRQVSRSNDSIEVGEDSLDSTAM